MTENLIDQGLELLVFGMGTVLVFLTALVLAIGVMSAVLKRYFPELEKPAAPPSSTVPQTVDSPEVIAVIAAALRRHRSKN